jgi:DNA modification methylase
VTRAHARTSPDFSWEAPASLVPWARNPRKKQPVARVAASIQRFGFGAPVVARPSDRRILAGHTRVLAALELDLETVPVRWLELADADADAMSLADNRIGEFAEWDEDQLASILREVRAADADVPEVVGWSERDVKRLLGEEESPEDDRPENFATRVQAGQVWQLGRHRLMCGSAIDSAHVQRLLSGAQPKLLVTDPPYGVELDMEWRDRLRLNVCGPAAESYMRSGSHATTSISGDTRADWSDAFDLVPSLEVAYVWHAARNASEVDLGLRRIGFDVRQQIIWSKPHWVPTRQAYHWQTEPCWYAVRVGKTASWIGPRDQSNLWPAPSPKALMAGSTEEKYDHPTQKPMLCMERPIANHALDPVYDPFAGSGTTLIAAERQGRVCYTMEIDPRFCDIVLARWEALTQQTAVLAE